MSDVLLEKVGANSFGFETVDDDGRKHRDQKVIRGNGSLTLTPDALTFQQAVPAVNTVIAVDHIEWVKTARAPHGKSFGFLPVLQVAFRAATETRIFGVCVGRQAETHEWVTALEGLLAARATEEVR